MLIFFPGVRKFDDDSDGRWCGHDFPVKKAQAQPESNDHYTVTGCAIKCPYPAAPMTRIIHWNYRNL